MKGVALLAAALGAALVLTACQDANRIKELEDQASAAESAADEAKSQVEDLSTRVDDLESRVDDLESSNSG